MLIAVIDMLDRITAINNNLKKEVKPIKKEREKAKIRQYNSIETRHVARISKWGG